MTAKHKIGTGGIIALSIMGVIVLFLGYKLAFPSVKVPKDTDTKAQAKENNDYTPESFPLSKGMRGESIRKVRAVLGLTPTDVFDQELEDALKAKFGITMISQSDYNYYAQYVTPNV